MCREMVQSDLALLERDAYLQAGGYEGHSLHRRDMNMQLRLGSWGTGFVGRCRRLSCQAKTILG